MKPKHFAYVYDRRGRLLAVGENQYDRTHAVQYRYARRSGEPMRVYLHAEMAAIIKALKRGTPHMILVTRHFADGTPAPSKPCPACWLAIKEAGILPRNVRHT
jgi:deoxycytidylate deaminase